MPKRARDNDDDSKTPELPRPWMGAFLTAFGNTCNMRASAQAAGITRQAVEHALKVHPSFRKRYEAARQDAIDALEAVVRKRAFDGSDTLAIFLLKAHRPEVYRETYHVTISVRQEAERIAEKYGIDPAEALAEADRILKGGMRRV